MSDELTDLNSLIGEYMQKYRDADPQVVMVLGAAQMRIRRQHQTLGLLPILPAVREALFDLVEAVECTIDVDAPPKAFRKRVDVARSVLTKALDVSESSEIEKLRLQLVQAQQELAREKERADGLALLAQAMGAGR